VSDTAIVSDEQTARQPVAPPPPPPEEPDAPIGRGMLLALGVIALAVVGALAGWLLTHRGNNAQTTTIVTTAPSLTTTTGAAATTQQVVVPQLVGLSEQAAMIKLGQSGLQPKVQTRTDGPRDGLVVTQRPPRSEKVKLGSSVLILVDRKPAPVVKQPTKAKPKPTPAQPAATMTTAPATTTTTPATTTTTAAAPAQPAQAQVPDVTGKTETDAVDAMNNAGLLVDLAFVPSKDPLGQVEGQAKPAGTTVPVRSHVQVNLSGGNGKFPPETIPDVGGKTLQDAVSAMNGAQLRLIYVKLPVATRAQVGKIVRQTPLAGGKAPQHAQVLIYLGVLQTGK